MTGAKRGRPPHPDTLTPAEWRVVEGVRHGLTNGAIAKAQGVSVDAVKFHVANALAKLGLPDRRMLRRWDGVRADSALNKRENGMDEGLGPVGQIARSVGDIAVARAWYGEVLELPHLFSFGTLAFFDCGGVRLMLSQGEGVAAESILYFRVGDVRAARVALEERGVAFRDAPHMIHRHDDGTEEWMTFFDDPDGRPLALMSRT